MSEFRFPSSTFVIAEIGINHNGSMEMAMKLIDAAAQAGADAVKFQKKTPRLSLPPALWDQVRDTPWGQRMTYIEYRERMEFSGKQLAELKRYAEEACNLHFSASAWDQNAANTLSELDLPFYKIASASLTDVDLVRHIGQFGKPVVLSTGMSTLTEINRAVSILRPLVPALGILVCTSAYPTKPEDINLERIHTMQGLYPFAEVGYSGHEAGLWMTLCAVAMGARIIERHITLDRTMPGTDQAASVEPRGFELLVREIRQFEKARGSGEIRLLDCDLPSIKRLRV
jgi:N-acetylneuraminate synthase